MPELSKKEQRKLVNRNPNSFKLLFLPYLARNEILKSMELPDVFIVSMLSSRMYATIARNLKFRNSRVYIEGTEENELRVSVTDAGGEEKSMLTLRTVRNFEKYDTITQLRIGGKRVKCVWKNDVMTCQIVSRDWIRQLLVDHIQDLFKSSSHVGLISPAELIFRLPVIRKITDIDINGEELLLDIVEEIIAKYQIRKGISIEGTFDDRIPFNSKILEIEHVFWRKPTFNSSFFLQNFRGQFAVLHDAFIIDSMLSVFITNWFSGKNHLNLEVILIQLSDRWPHFSGFVEGDLQGRVLRGDVSRRPAKREIYPRIHGYKPHTLDCSLWMDVKRETDGRWASFNVGLKEFQFVVWN